MFVNKLYLLLLLVISTVYCEEKTPPIGDVTSLLLESFGKNFSTTNPFDRDTERITELLLEKCKKANVPDPFSGGKSFYKEEAACYKNIFNDNPLTRSSIFELIDDMKTTVCTKTSQFEQCAKAAREKIKPCLNEAERAYLDKEVEGQIRLFEFLCYNDGERVTHFVKEGGLVCVTEQMGPISKCLNKTHVHNETDDIAGLKPEDNIFEKPFVKEACDDFVEMRSCAVDALRRCEKKEAANFVVSVTDIMLRSTTCKSQMQTSSSLSAGAVVAILIGVGLLLAVVAFGVRRWQRRRARASARRLNLLS